SLKVISQVGIGTTTPQAALDIVSESSGILIPRMTATQIEQINQPTEGELVFSTTETGATVNTIGFWYFTGSTWAPIYATSSSGDNIYNSDGNLAGNRIVDLNNFDLNFGPEKLFISGNATGSVGILTATPTEQLDINGNLRVRTLTEGNVITTAEGILTIDNNVFHRFGDLRFSALSLDHNGWYLMDGRPLSTLPAHLQSRAANLGIVGFLPDASGKYIKQGTPGITTGANTVTLNQSNMPDFTINRNTNFVSHTHPIVSPGYTFIRGTN